MEGIVTLPRPPPPPFDIDTMEPIEPPWQAIKEWNPDDEPDLDWFNISIKFNVSDLFSSYYAFIFDASRTAVNDCCAASSSPPPFQSHPGEVR